ncbi:hypothetical protein EFZ10_02590 [Tatumella sp. TA1]|uniref:RcnB family protein n=1 Tax=Rosenbergiella collisarenosi TaxID=1544695 RepID=UPI0012FDFBB7|nr:RcnB family protein [Rosenbergiella collisarenosi]MBT0720009.1 hypothetical protein [Rosenbergiella collisarenosi]QGX90620.1 hypothetical protein EFZ10_02590 [Tatumella sp. TA1]
MLNSLSSTTKALLVGLTVSFLTVSCADHHDNDQSETTVNQPAAQPDVQQPAVEQPAPAKPAEPEAKKFNDPLELASFTGDFRQYQAGDVVPDMYRTAQYTISKWQLRKLPAPSAGSHWTYFGGSYVLITDAEGKILRMFSGEIIYR